MPATLRDAILAELESIRTVDCHSHTCSSADYYASGARDLFSLMSYYERDFQGTTGKWSGELYAGLEDGGKWEVLRDVLARNRNVSYWRHNMVMYQRLFGLEAGELNDGNWEGLHNTIRQRSAAPDWYRHVTEDVCNLETQMRNVPWFEDWEPQFFTCILRMEPALELHRADVRRGLEARVGMEVGSLADAKAALRKLTEEYKARGSRGIKLAHAYSRTLHSEDVPEAEATALFARAVVGQELNEAEVKRLQDHIIFFLARMAGEMGQVFDIHTGVQGNWCPVTDSDPLHLTGLISANRGTRFSLYHAGYPYSREIGMLAKHFPNVVLNMAWIYVITMEGARQSLSEWLDLVAGDRILGFGSDVGYPEMIYGHLVMARSCIADVLAQKVERDFVSEECAVELCRKLMRENGMEVYGLEARG